MQLIDIGANLTHDSFDHDRVHPGMTPPASNAAPAPRQGRR